MRIAVNAAASKSTLFSGDDHDEYAEFRIGTGRPVGREEADYSERLDRFKRRRSEVGALNSRQDASWFAEINHFADYSKSDFKALLGHIKSAMNVETGSASFLQMESSSEAQLPGYVDWRSGLNSSAFMKQQGSCGSCWAAAATSALEMHAEISTKRQPRELSFKQLVDCVPNPDHCGGTGGCDGSTAELAFQYVRQHGLGESDAPCRPSPSSPYLKLGGYVRLETNQLQPLLHAVAHKGPVVVAVDATSWALYGHGVFDGCSRDATVNHAVVLLGYGRDHRLEKNYWIIRNSWGRQWGEGGDMRLLRHASDEGEDGYCGVDRHPQEGVWCKGVAGEIPVCGMCGILTDSSYPKEVMLSDITP